MTRPQLPTIRDVHPGTDPDDHSKGSLLLQLSTDARRGRIALTAAVLIASAVLPATASAGTVGVNSRSLDFTASAGEANRVTLTNGRTPREYRIEDAFALVVGPGCTQDGPNAAFCSPLTDTTFARWNVLAGDQSDVVTNGTTEPRGLFSAQNGGDGEDILNGGPVEDLLFDGPGIDTLNGNGGDDRLLIRGSFPDRASCGTGVDSVIADAMDDVAADCESVDRGVVDPTPTPTPGPGGGGGGGDVGGTGGGTGAGTGGGATSGPGATPGNDLAPATLAGACETRSDGTPGNDTLTGTPGSDFIVALAGNDIVSGLGGDDCVFGEDGNDRLSGGDGADYLRGDAGDDRLSGGSGADRLTGNVGGDNLSGGADADLLAGGASRDVLKGGSGNDGINGGAGNDSVRGDAGADQLAGGPGSDTVSGGSGRDRVFGGSGRDRIDLTDGARDRVSCGAGRDTVRADRSDRVARDCERVIRIG